MTAQLTAELVALRSALEALEARVASLQSQLHNAHQATDLTMRNQLRCRACSCRRIAHAFHVLDRADNDARKKLSLYQPSWWSSKTRGEMEAYICTRCGLMEWWIKDAGGLEPHQDHLEILDGEVDDGGAPYR